MKELIGKITNTEIKELNNQQKQEIFVVHFDTMEIKEAFLKHCHNGRKYAIGGILSPEKEDAAEWNKFFETLLRTSTDRCNRYRKCKDNTPHTKENSINDFYNMDKKETGKFLNGELDEDIDKFLNGDWINVEVDGKE